MPTLDTLCRCSGSLFEEPVGISHLCIYKDIGFGDKYECPVLGQQGAERHEAF